MRIPQGNAWAQLSEARRAEAIRTGARETYKSERGPAARRRRAAERAAHAAGERTTTSGFLGRRAREGDLDPALYTEYGTRRPTRATTT